MVVDRQSKNVKNKRVYVFLSKGKWLSGLKHWFAKSTYYLYQGFESLLFRFHSRPIFHNYYLILKYILKRKPTLQKKDEVKTDITFDYKRQVDLKVSQIK